MNIDTGRLKNSVTEFSYYLKQEECSRLDPLIRFGSEGLFCKGELLCKGKDVTVEGTYEVTCSTPCDRCSEEVLRVLSGDVKIRLQPLEEKNALKGDLELNVNDIDTEFYTNNKINLDLIFEDQFLLDYPLVNVCKKDCKGLCPQCGVNLNHSSCKCLLSDKDNPFAILKKLQL